MKKLKNILFAGLISASSFFSCAAVAAVSGKVYQDIDGDGSIDVHEPGIKGVTVTAFDADGNAQGTANSLADGTYTFNATGTPPYRIEFTNIPGGHYDGAIGADSNSKIRFISSSNSTDLNLALQVPIYYVPDPSAVVMAITVAPTGGSDGLTDTTLTPGLMRLSYDATGNSDGSGDINQPDPDMDLNFDQVGTTWGAGFQRKSGLLFPSALLKRHSGLGPLVRPATGSGTANVAVDGVYKVQFNTTTNSTSSLLGGFTLNGVSPASGNAGAIDLGTVTREITNAAISASNPNALKTEANYSSYDVDALAKVGKRGFGGSQVDATDNFLWLVNLNQRSLIRVDISAPASLPNSGAISGSLVSHFAIDYSGLPTCNGTYRPWALKFDATMGYVGVTCDGSTGGNNDIHAHVLSFDPTTGSGFNLVLDIDLAAANYSRESSQYNLVGAGVVPCGLGAWDTWNRWGNSWSELGLSTAGNTDTTFGAEVSCPQPILADLDFDVNGDMVIGMMDRLSLQMDRTMRAGDVSDPGYYSVDSAGDTLHACSTDSGFILEGRAGCMIDSDTKDDNDNPADRLSLADGPGNQGEFYFQDHSTVYDSGTAARHVENNLGAVSIVPGSGEVLVTTYDSILGDFNQGLHWYRTRTAASGTPGTRADQYQISVEGSGLLTTKGMSLGDVELILPPAPLELGNRVWNDVNSNGVQDAGEAGLDGVDVTLNCGGADFVQTTANGGQYLFTDNNVAGGVPRNTSCTISVPTEHNGLTLTTQTATVDEPIGSDPDQNTGSFTFITGEAGQNNHTYDIGYKASVLEATLNIVKQVIGATSTESFSINVSGGSPATNSSFNLVNGQTETLTVTPGTYNIAEQGPLPEPPAGYRWESPAYSGESVTLADGETATITISNTLIPIESLSGVLTINKTVNWSGNPPDAGQQFSYEIEGSSGFTTINDTITDGGTKTYDVPVGTYTVTETSPGAGWSTTYTVEGTANSTSGVVELGSSAAPTPLPIVAVSGTVFRDFNSDGAMSSGAVTDVGMAGVTVTAYGSDNVAVGSTQTIADGTYTLTPTGDGPWRIEFTNLPDGYEPSFMGGSNDSVQFVIGGDATGVDFAVNRANDYSQASPAIAMSTYIYGNATSTERAITRINWDASGSPITISQQNNIGSTWGLAYKRDTEQLFASAVVKRHSGLGSLGLGGIYVVTNPNTATPVSANFVDLAAAPFNISFGNLPDNPSRGLGTDFAAAYPDVLAFPAAGTQGIGDIDLSGDGNTLWAMNLYAETGGMGSLIKLDVTNGVVPASAEAFPLANMSGMPSCTGGTLRPWALTIRNGVGYMGAVCSAESSFSRNDLAAYVLSFDPANPSAVTTTLSIPMGYTKGAAHNGNEATPSFSNLWHPWRNTLTTPAPSGAWPGAVEENESPSPVLADIEFDEHGAMILGFLDRRGMQWGGQLIRSDGSVNGTLINTAGDIIRACPDNNGDFILESAAVCGGVTGAGAGNNEGFGSGEFYLENGLGQTANHEDPASGGLAVRMGSDEVASSTMDPSGEFWSGGVIWLSNANGQRLRDEEVYAGAASYADINQSFAKSIGQGDVEILTEPAPIQK